MSRIFICQILPLDKTHLNENISQAANNFCYSIISAISPSKVYSIIPIFIEDRSFLLFKDPLITPIFIRVFPQNKVLRTINVLLENLILISNIVFNKEKIVWFYNITKHNLLSYFFLRFLTTKKCFIILADYNPPYRILDINNIISKMISKANGIIALSNGSIPYINNDNIIVHPGIVNNIKAHQNSKIGSVISKRFLFCGVLADHTGIMLALQTFAQLPQYELIISGQGKYSAEVLTFTKKYSNIHFRGFLKYSEYLKLLNSVDFLLSLRNPNYDENQSNFPSKIIEAMINNVCVISTYTYNTLQDNTYFKIDFSTESLSSLITNIQKLSDIEIRDKQNYARQYVINNFSENSWLKKVIQIENKIG